MESRAENAPHKSEVTKQSISINDPPIIPSSKNRFPVDTIFLDTLLSSLTVA